MLFRSRIHFTKVGDQTEEGLRAMIRLAEQHGLPCAAVRELCARLERARAQAEEGAASAAPAGRPAVAPA